MVIVALRHIAGELCLNTLFDGISRNFNKSTSIGRVNVGDYFSRIAHMEFDEEYHNCTVTAVVDVKDSNGVSNGHQFIHIRYTEFRDELDEDGVDINSMSEQELDAYLLENGIDIDDGDDDDLIDMDDDGIDYSEIDVIDSEYDDGVGLNSAYYEFYK